MRTKSLHVAGSWLAEDVRLGWQRILINWVGGSWLVPRMLRHLAYRSAGVRSHSPNIFPNLTVTGCASNLRIGRRTYINAQVLADCMGEIRIGNDCLIGQRAMILTSHHPPASDGRPQKLPVPRSVTIGDRVWIGAGALIVPGVTIGHDVVVAAGSVVTGDCLPCGFYAGVPARRIKEFARLLYREGA